MSKVKKALIPVAGLGTRFLPATKAVPKEMLPIFDKPALLYAIEEVVEAGVEEVVLVQGRGKECIENFFDRSPELEQALKEKNSIEILERIEKISELAKIISVRQLKPLGLGHAVLCGKSVIGEEPFAVLLPDELMIGQPSVTKSLVNSYESTGISTVGIYQVPEDEVQNYGVVALNKKSEDLYEVTDLVEKPKKEKAPSNWMLPGRYVFSSKIFGYLEKTKKGAGNEIQLTDAMMQLMKEDGLNAVPVKCKRFDTGNKLGYLKANVEVALAHPQVGEEFRQFLTSLIKG